MRRDYHDVVSLELARRIASELPNRPEWIRLALQNLDRWTMLNQDAPGLVRNYSEWRALLMRPVSEVCSALTALTNEGQRLRQNSPFAGALTPSLVWDIKRRIRHEQTSA